MYYGVYGVKYFLKYYQGSGFSGAIWLIASTEHKDLYSAYHHQTCVYEVVQVFLLCTSCQIVCIITDKSKPW